MNIYLNRAIFVITDQKLLAQHASQFLITNIKKNYCISVVDS